MLSVGISSIGYRIYPPVVFLSESRQWSIAVETVEAIAVEMVEGNNGAAKRPGTQKTRMEARGGERLSGNVLSVSLLYSQQRGTSRA
ncbi:hypothetical protein MRX96_002807 [Rhipicephalus microplus]